MSKPLGPDYERIVARIRELVDADEERRLLCASDPDCPCSYKDCYECGKWHNCRHTPWTAIREVLNTCPLPPGDGEAS